MTKTVENTTDTRPRSHITRLLWIAAGLFILHVAEEAPGFVDWINGMLAEPITRAQFVYYNAGGLIITVSIAAASSFSEDVIAALFGTAWLSFVMFANAVVHVAATLVFSTYSPGVVTSILLYLPFYFLFIRAVATETAVRTGAIATAASVGAVPMLIHGYLIIYEGRTLFGG